MPALELEADEKTTDILLRGCAPSRDDVCLARTDPGGETATSGKLEDGGGARYRYDCGETARECVVRPVKWRYDGDSTLTPRILLLRPRQPVFLEGFKRTAGLVDRGAYPPRLCPTGDGRRMGPH
jgi:hypothetical protein